MGNIADDEDLRMSGQRQVGFNHDSARAIDLRAAFSANNWPRQDARTPAAHKTVRQRIVSVSSLLRMVTRSGRMSCTTEPLWTVTLKRAKNIFALNERSGGYDGKILSAPSTSRYERHLR